MRIALITCRVLPEPDPDEALLLGALRAAGAEPALVAWDDPRASLRGFDRAVLRSAWNYHDRPDAFSAWLDRAEAATRVVNPPAAVRWNLHKGYLRALAARGVPIVPTAFAPAGARPWSLAELAHARGWDDVVVKPAISAASARTRRFARGQLADAQAFLDEQRREREMMVQPWQRSVETQGEHSLVWIAGEITHGVRKAVRLLGGPESVSDATDPGAHERAFAHRVLAAAPGGLTYARIDVMRGEGGELLLSELELIEPSLFLQQSRAALGRLLAALLAP